jgi:hypothetical protein
MSVEPLLRFRLANRRALGATGGALVLLIAIAIAPLGAGPSEAELRAAYAERHAQEFVMTSTHLSAASAATSAITRDGFDSTPGPETFIRGGTNHDWAKLVLLYAGWPITDNNVTVITRWMRQENYTDNWWNRANPLNIGAGGFASYGNLDESARVVAKALTTSRGYAQIAAAFAASAETSVTEYAIWASPWAGGHYAWGGHWHYDPVPVITAPASAWGR